MVVATTQVRMDEPCTMIGIRGTCVDFLQMKPLDGYKRIYADSAALTGCYHGSLAPSVQL
jgi:hypothetical protein